MKKVHGIRVGEIIRKEPGNGMPAFVRQAAAQRGYADAKDPVSLFVNDSDIAAAFECAAQGDGARCVMAQAGQRLGAKSVYFYRSTAWIDFGDDLPILRFQTTKSIYENVIAPFDEGDREKIVPGIYPLTPPSPGNSLARRRELNENREIKPRNTRGGKRKIYHTERVVMAAQV